MSVIYRALVLRSVDCLILIVKNIESSLPSILIAFFLFYPQIPLGPFHSFDFDKVLAGVSDHRTYVQLRHSNVGISTLSFEVACRNKFACAFYYRFITVQYSYAKVGVFISRNGSIYFNCCIRAICSLIREINNLTGIPFRH